MMKLLVEIGVEELPAIPFLKEEKNILPKWQETLANLGVTADFEFYYTPRRLVFVSSNFPAKTADKLIEKIGAPKKIALQDDKWSKAALSFAQKCDISEDELKFKEIDGKEVLYFATTENGKNSKEIIQDLLNNFMHSLNFGRSMRWGANTFEFIRPIRSLAVCLDNELVECEIYGIKSQMGFYPHRKFGYELINFGSIDEYFDKIAKNGIILKASDRKALILEQFKQIEQKSGLSIEIDEDLLSEVVAITEHPTALLGEFEKEFLAVPPEVIITSMRDNQRYFPVFADKNLSNHFVVVSNSISDDNAQIIAGNEKVLRARLSDAMFFWENDLKAEFSANALKNVVYMKGLGTIYDKEVREKALAGELAKAHDKELKTEFGDGYESELDRAIMLSKIDLTSAMVDEFSELQGIMGSYYATHRKEHPLVARAIYEQYLPDGENSELPQGIFSSIVAICGKLDTLMGFFSINKIPTGNKDPYALRRQANGVIKIAIEQNLKLNLDEFFEKTSQNYVKFDTKELKNFITDRFYSLTNANPSVIKAVLKSGESDLCSINKAILALDEITNENDFTQNFDTFKRLANIIKGEKEFAKIDESLFEKEAEKSLYKAYSELNPNNDDIKSYLKGLFSLKGVIDKFFDDVIINADDEKIRQNRLALVGAIYQSFLKIADIKEISL